MAVFADIRDKWNGFWTRVGTTMAPVNRVLGAIGTWIWRLRGVLISIPVAVAAWRLAVYNKANLPEEVGLNMLSTGEFAKTIPLQAAVMGPLFLTVACLVLVCCSRKNLYPWLISVFTLAIPLLLLLTNNMQALMDLFSTVINYFTAA